VNWVKVYSSNNLQHIELLKHILKENGIEAIVMNKQDSIYVTIGEIDLMVNVNDVLRSKKVISETKL
jgi:hypothetical protein